MKCDEVQSLQGPYLDSELDARTSLEIEQHLKSCADCGRQFAEEQKVEAQLKAGLNQGSRTPALWERIERSVGQGLAQRGREAQRGAEGSLFPGISVSSCVAGLRSVWFRLREGWQASRWAWTGLATVWAVILVLNFTAGESDPRLVAGQKVPSVSEMRFAWKQKQLLMADLAFISEPAPADKSKAALPEPQSHRQTDNLNT